MSMERVELIEAQTEITYDVSSVQQYWTIHDGTNSPISRKIFQLDVVSGDIETTLDIIREPDL